MPTATIPEGATVLKVARTGSIQYRTPEGVLGWYRPQGEALPDDAPVPAVAPAAPVPQNANRYEGRIRQYRERIAVLERTRDNAVETDDRRGRAATDMEQFIEAVSVLEEAAQVSPGEEVWFVSDEGEFRAIIPPAVPGIYNRERHRIESFNMYYHAKDPVEIVVLRRAASKPGAHIYEKPPGTFPIMDWEARTFEGWGSWELFSARDAKRYRAV
jgi:hypothetical protein